MIKWGVGVGGFKGWWVVFVGDFMLGVVLFFGGFFGGYFWVIFFVLFFVVVELFAWVFVLFVLHSK